MKRWTPVPFAIAACHALAGCGGGGSAVPTQPTPPPVTEAWEPTSVVGAAPGRAGHTAVWVGSRMIVWGGYNSGYHRLHEGASYDPATDTWTSISSAG